jgi:hypothetical protein
MTRAVSYRVKRTSPASVDYPCRSARFRVSRRSRVFPRVRHVLRGNPLLDTFRRTLATDTLGRRTAICSRISSLQSRGDSYSVPHFLWARPAAAVSRLAGRSDIRVFSPVLAGFVPGGTPCPPDNQSAAGRCWALGCFGRAVPFDRSADLGHDIGAGSFGHGEQSHRNRKCAPDGARFGTEQLAAKAYGSLLPAI